MRSAWRVILLALAATLMLANAARATDRGRLLHNFSSMRDGANPAAGLLLDAAGNLYGTAFSGGATSGCYNNDGCGVVFELSPMGGEEWKWSVLYTFTGGNDGGGSFAGLLMDAAGNLYGTTRFGGTHNWGTVFKLSPTTGGKWTETVLYSFCSVPNCVDGGDPWSSLVFDSAGNLYGTTYAGGDVTECNSLQIGCGVVFKLTPGAGGWRETVLHGFRGRDGASPVAGVAIDSAGNLYGTTLYGGIYGDGVVFELAPTPGGWEWTVIHNFADREDGANPAAAVILDSAGNLYGTTYSGGDVDKCGGITLGCGVVFELTPPTPTTPTSGGHWTETRLHVFTGGPDGGNPQAPLAFDAAGNLYGTTARGVIFELTLTSRRWTELVLHTFTSPDGGIPTAGLTVDLEGNLYSTTYYGGEHGYGMVYELIPK